MKVIATTTGGVIIEATNDEVKQILRAVTGEMPKDIAIGQKIPAIDYAGTIEKIKSLNQNYDFNRLKESANTLVSTIVTLQQAVDNAAKI